jgi:hypothetical protein
MKSFKQYLFEQEYDVLGHELKVGDFIMFKSSGINLNGQIQDFIDGDKPKWVVKPLGWSGDESQRDKIKKSYKINVTSKDIYKCNYSDSYIKALKDKNIII